MDSAAMNVPVASSGLAAGFVGENQAISDQQNTWTSVNLTPKKSAILVRMSNELLGDSAVNVASYIVTEGGRAFGELEDRCGFAGTGTSAFGGMIGLSVRLMQAATAGSRVTAGAGVDTFAEVTASDLASLLAKCPARAKRGAKWYCSETFFSAVMERLMIAASGNAASDVAAGAPRRFLGYPVVAVPGDILPASTTADMSGLFMCAFGNLQQAALFGLRRDVSVSILNERFSEYDQVGIQLISRFDAVTWDAGTATAPGAVVALVGA
jgi:HK97 family phage major capsid protein